MAALAAQLCVEFLKTLLELARELVATEKETQPEEDEDRGKAALTELFQEVRSEKTPVVVERLVADIDEIVRLVRFPGWQHTAAGEREVRKALRKSLLRRNVLTQNEKENSAFGRPREPSSHAERQDSTRSQAGNVGGSRGCARASSAIQRMHPWHACRVAQASL